MKSYLIDLAPYLSLSHLEMTIELSMPVHTHTHTHTHIHIYMYIYYISGKIISKAWVHHYAVNICINYRTNNCFHYIAGKPLHMV